MCVCVDLLYITKYRLECIITLHIQMIRLKSDRIDDRIGLDDRIGKSHY